MVLLAANSVIVTLLMIALFVVSLFLILLVLVQRGKGGGLTGALGGMGGQSAFGSKAGDVFTRVTVITAVVWILLCLLTVQLLGPGRNATAETNPPSLQSGGAGSSDGVRLLDDSEQGESAGSESAEDVTGAEAEDASADDSERPAEDAK